MRSSTTSARCDSRKVGRVAQLLRIPWPSQVEMFADDLAEFDESREIVQSLIEEYAGSESPGYIN